MYRVILLKKYKKSLKKIDKSGRNSKEKIEETVRALASGKKLPEKYKDHALTGNMSKYRECHIKGNLLLVYYKKDDILVLVLVDVGSHSEIL